MTRLVVPLVLLVAACGSDAPSDASTGSTGTSSSTGSTAEVSTSAAGASSTGGSSSTAGSSESSSGEESSTTGASALDDCDALDLFVGELESADPKARAGMVQAFVLEMQYGEHGLPLRCEDRVVFLSDGPGAVAGDFNDWSPDALEFEAAFEGAPLWIAPAEVPTPGGLYKRVVQSEFVADPWARRYGWDEFGEYTQIDALPERSHHERWPAFADAAGRLESRTVRVFVPAAANGGADVPALYMHDGQNVFSPDAFFGGWQTSETIDALVDASMIEPVLVVAIDNTPARLAEYSHVPDDLGDGPIGGLADAYADFVVDGVMPFVEARYPVRIGREHTAVLGSSMGGLVSLHLALRHPDRFGHVGSMSGTLGWGTFGASNETMPERYGASPPRGLSVYLDSGGNGPCPDQGADNYCENVAFAELLRSLGWVDEQDLFYRWSSGAPHNEAAWAQRLPDALIDWFPGA